MEAVKEETTTKSARVFELERELIMTSDALTVVARALNDLAQSDARMDAADNALIFGAAHLLEGIAANCERAVS